MTESEIIYGIYNNTTNNNLKWNLTSIIPEILYKSTNIFIISCYDTSNEMGRLYLFKYRVPVYDGEHDTYYYSENTALVFVEKGQITWSNTVEHPKLDDLYDYIRSKNSSISSFLY